MSELFPLVRRPVRRAQLNKTICGPRPDSSRNPYGSGGDWICSRTGKWVFRNYVNASGGGGGGD